MPEAHEFWVVLGVDGVDGSFRQAWTEPSPLRAGNGQPQVRSWLSSSNAISEVEKYFVVVEGGELWRLGRMCFVSVDCAGSSRLYVLPSVGKVQWPRVVGRGRAIPLSSP